MSDSLPSAAAPQKQEMREVIRLLSHYAESHRNPTNEKIHFVCVPVIVWTVLGLVWSIHPWAAYAGAALALIYYVTLSIPFAFGMTVMASIMLLILQNIPQAYVLPTAGAVFVIAWIGQFIGHKIEGKKPSFFEDVRYLLIGPLFVLSFLYRRLNIRY
ncbi:Mpo1 family 2-hydroxy fatty acid dioxygenase [Undibacterium cyanobacteriorum]